MEETKSKKGFNYAMIALILFALSFILNFLEVTKVSEFVDLVIGLFGFIGILVGVFGLFVSIKGLREPNSVEQVLGITINGIFAVVLIWVVVEVMNGLI